MTKIHINSFLGDEEPLDPKSLPEGFESCATKLETIAKKYREMAAYFRDKEIKVIETNGYPHCGSFTVDEIDTQRLKQSGKVIDFADNPAERNPLFSIDSELDKVLSDLDSTSYIDNVLLEDGDDDNDETLHFNNTYDLSSIMMRQSQAPDFEDSPGVINLDVVKVADGEYSFSLKIRDLGNDLPIIHFQRETGVFKYHCGACDETHTQTLDNVHKSLKTACALLSNFAYMARDSKEFCMALTAIDDDLRLLGHLVAFDYALESDEETPSTE